MEKIVQLISVSIVLLAILTAYTDDIRIYRIEQTTDILRSSGAKVTSGDCPMTLGFTWNIQYYL